MHKHLLKHVFVAVFFLLGAGQVFSQTLSGYYKEGFEGTVFPPPGWRTENVSGIVTWARDTYFPYEGSAAAYISYDYPDGEDWLIMPKFQVSAGDSLVFHMVPDLLGYPPDSLVVRLSVTDSALGSFTTKLLVLEEGVNYPLGSWERFAIDLNSFAGQQVFIAFSHYNEDGEGIILDKIQIGQIPVIDASVASFEGPFLLKENTAGTPSVIVNNGSPTTETFNVTMEITGGYTSTMSSGPVAADDYALVTFASWTPAAAGIYTAKVYTSLPNDGFHGNDTLYYNITVMPPFENYGWSSNPALPQAMWGSASAYLQNCVSGTDTGYVYHIGGADDNMNILARGYVYNTVTNAWSTIADMPVGRIQAGAATVQGKIYISGGYTGGFYPTDAGHVYNPATNSWSAIANMPVAVEDYAIGTYADSLVYIVGGIDGFDDINNVQIYNVNTNTWSSGTAFPGIPVAGARMGISGNTIVFVGGYSQIQYQTVNQAWKGVIDPVNPANISWSKINEGYPGGPAGRLAAGVSPTSDKIYFTAGDPDGYADLALTGTYAYNVNTSSWEYGPDKPHGVNNVYNIVPFVKNDSVYMACIGGYDGLNVVTHFDAINIGALQKGILSNDTAICGEAPINLVAANGSNYAWSPSILFTDPSLQNQSIFPGNDMTIYLTYTPIWGCDVTDSIVIDYVGAPVVTTSAIHTTTCTGTATATVSGGGSSFTYLWDDPSQQTTATATGLCPGTYTCIVTNEIGCSDTVSVTVISTLGQEEQKETTVRVYPNPASDYVMIDGSWIPSGETQILLTDISGKIMLEVNVAGTNAPLVQQLPLTGIASGVYMIAIRDMETTRNFRLVVK